jgi:diaminopimelate decarboxylase
MNIFEIKNGRLHMDGADLTEVAAEFGTPLYVMSRAAIDARIAGLKRDFTDRYERVRAAYASKAFLCTAMCRIVEEAGLALDVVSGGELFTAMKAGFPAEHIEFHGNNKTREEIGFALDCGVGRVIVDAPGELGLIEDVLAAAPRSVYRPKILFRVNPGVEAETHDHIMTGHAGSKFGFPIDGDELYGLIGDAVGSPFVDFAGIHFHIGSQIFTNDSYLAALRRALGMLLKIRDVCGCDTPELNIGGGFAIRYEAGDEPPPYGYYLSPVMSEAEEFCAAHGLKRPVIVVEPGRSIVGEAGVTLYTVGAIRETSEGGKFVAVDGGMSDNIRPALYGAAYEAAVANKADAPACETVTVVGKCCESGDRLIEKARLPVPETGDVLAVFSTGAYGYSMASNYNKLTLPAVALVEEGKARLIVRRQTYEDIVARDLPL